MLAITIDDIPYAYGEDPERPLMYFGDRAAAAPAKAGV